MSALLSAALARIELLEASLAFYANGGTDGGADARHALGLVPPCDKCGAPAWGTRDPSHKMGRLHEADNTTADQWCRKV